METVYGVYHVDMQTPPTYFVDPAMAESFLLSPFCYDATRCCILSCQTSDPALWDVAWMNSFYMDRFLTE